MVQVICLQCKYFGRPVKKKRGSKGLEVLGWTLFPLGVPYTLWRILSQYKACAGCGSREIFSTESPTGKRLLELELGLEPEEGDVHEDVPAYLRGQKMKRAAPPPLPKPVSEEEQFEAFLKEKNHVQVADISSASRQPEPISSNSQSTHPPKPEVW